MVKRGGNRVHHRVLPFEPCLYHYYYYYDYFISFALYRFETVAEEGPAREKEAPALGFFCGGGNPEPGGTCLATCHHPVPAGPGKTGGG